MKNIVFSLLIFGSVHSLHAEELNVTVSEENPREVVKLEIKWDIKKLYPDLLEVEYQNIRAEGSDGSTHPILALDSNDRIITAKVDTLCKFLGHEQEVRNYVRHMTPVKYETSMPPRQLSITEEQKQNFVFSLVKAPSPYRIYDFRCKDSGL